ncbi:transposase [Bacillus sp. ISL-40]|uniref:helix-turn-helix domain-containing protein n=1 Tax=unclassified Bacillus (in: firmicutes) TaxID=185979 RepID=UPI001BEB5189|nr:MULTISPECIES: helix-turn-helix domain-containing protein [unclassified Bacillus (in: firmicutes)]MBT2697592.1 transposase [Bacillus sp. ISL-40]MBT2720857.1 transposase [Bacillus sp. ISL-46]MBT2742297.1 transposase [Bacillus sp. ISL-77]
MGKNVYSGETKWAVVKDKIEGKLTNREIMDKYGIINISQIKTWMRWYKSGEMHREQ